MTEWYQVFDSHGIWIMDVLAYTAAGAVNDVKSQGKDAATAYRLYQTASFETEG